MTLFSSARLGLSFVAAALLLACGGGGGGVTTSALPGVNDPVVIRENPAISTPIVSTPVDSPPTNSAPINNASTVTVAAVLTDEQAKAVALKLWRNDDLSVHPKGSCAGCHGADFFDLARIGSTNTDILRRATADGATPEQAQALAQTVKVMRTELKLPETNARTFRPLQPGGSVLLPGLTDSTELEHVVAVKRDVAFAQQIEDMQLLPTLTGARIGSLADAKKARNELLDLAQGTNLAGSNPNFYNMRTLPSGILYPKWSADLHHGPKEGTFNDWTADIAHDPKDAKFKADWLALQSVYLANPSNLNFWKMYNQARIMTFVPLFKCVLPSSVCEKSDDFNKNKFLSALMGQHMMRLDATGKMDTFAKGAIAFSYLDDPLDPAFIEMKKRENFPMLPSALWEVGDTGRTMLVSDAITGSFRKNLTDLGFPDFAQKSVDEKRTAIEEEDALRLAWFWIGATFDPSMSRINKSNATRVGEYMVGTLVQSRYFNHNALSTLLRLTTKGFLPEANVRNINGTVTYEQPKFLMEYGYAWAYGRAVLSDGMWNENKAKSITISPELKAQSTRLHAAMMGNGFRMSMYLQMEQLAQTEPTKKLNTTQLTQLREEWLGDRVNTFAPGNPIIKGGLCSMYLHFAKHHPITLAQDEALLDDIRVSAGISAQTWKNQPPGAACGY